MRYTGLFTAALAAMLVIMVPAGAFAGAPTDRVRLAADKVISILKDPSLKPKAKETERRAKIMKAVRDVFDFEEMAKRSLGQYWRQRSDAEKKDFTDLYADLLERSYINRIESYSDEKIVYGGEKVDADFAVVPSKFITKRNEDITADYKLMLKGGTWFVYDMVIENVSLVNNYRIQFNKIIRTSSYEELVRKMKNKRESEVLAAPGADAGK
jgi:phospholipid transport system substrate-binding protein